MNRRFAFPAVTALALTALFGSLALPAAGEAIDGGSTLSGEGFHG